MAWVRGLLTGLYFLAFGIVMLITIGSDNDDHGAGA